MARRSRGISGLSRLLEAIPAESVEAMVNGVAEIAEGAAAADGMATMFGRPMTAKLSKAKVRKASATLVMYGTLAGPWTWLEEGVPTHEVGRRRSETPSGRDTGRGGRFLAVSTPDGPRAKSSASYPQRGTWTRVVEDVDRALPEIVVSTYDELIGT